MTGRVNTVLLPILKIPISALRTLPSLLGIAILTIPKGHLFLQSLRSFERTILKFAICNASAEYSSIHDASGSRTCLPRYAPASIALYTFFRSTCSKGSITISPVWVRSKDKLKTSGASGSNDCHKRPGIDYRTHFCQEIGQYFVGKVLWWNLWRHCIKHLSCVPKLLPYRRNKVGWNARWFSCCSEIA